jgi:hypothetical protein
MPRQRLASPGGTAFAPSGLVEARVWGLITQQRYRSVADPAPPPAPDTRCAPSFPRKRWDKDKGGGGGVDKENFRLLKINGLAGKRPESIHVVRRVAGAG